MSDNANHQDDLPELSDEDISLLHQIATLAQHQSLQSDPPAPPFRALFAAYDAVFAEQSVQQEHDGAVFRVLLRVGEAAREGGGRAGVRGVDLVGCLKEVLQAQGITVVEDEGEGGDGLSEVTRGSMPTNLDGQDDSRGPVKQRQKTGKRRVSFDDARLDETWLIEHSQPLAVLSPRQQSKRSPRDQPARRSNRHESDPSRRARSASSQRPASTLTRHSAPKHYQESSPSTVYTSEAEDQRNLALLYQPSQTQLEHNAEAFAVTSTIRAARRCMHIWHDRALVLQATEEQARAIAAAHDRRMLLKQAFDEWRAKLRSRKKAHERELLRSEQDDQAGHVWRQKLLYRAFSQWQGSLVYQREQVRKCHAQILRMRYFHRWRTLAVDNALKARSILLKKYLAVWRARLTRRQLREEQALAKCEESRMKACWRAWFWHFCCRRVESWREDSLKRRALESWRASLSALAAKSEQARRFCDSNVTRRALHVLRDRLGQRQQAAQLAQSCRDRKVMTGCLHTLVISARLEPLGRTLTLKITLDLQRKAFRVWLLHLQLLRQATEADRQRILHNAWTDWNDALRCRALAQKIDERVLIENLYRWVLAERGRLMRRRVEARVARQVLSTWVMKVRDESTRFAVAERAFKDGQQRRTMSSVMVKLHLAMRRREDAERTAVEFASARALPNALAALMNKFRAVEQINKWAVDARFYTLCTRYLAVWKEKTTQNQQHRKRDAYARVRARVKIRLVGGCLAAWRAKTAHIVSMDEEADRRANARLVASGRQAFGHWRAQTAEIHRIADHAESRDRRNLIRAAFLALTTRYEEVATLGEQAESFKRDTDLTVLATTLKKLQWAQFTAARRVESAEALWARNRDTHIRNMVRVWAALTASRRAARRGEDEEPESPSLRPASRAASRSRQAIPSSPPAMGAVTPAYMRTPSRNRRAGRFRPLPTPAPGTPFAFETAYLATTPAPLPVDPALFAEDGALTPQVTPFARKLRAGGFGSRRTLLGTGGVLDAEETTTPAPALRTSVFGRSVIGPVTAKSVRFAGASRFGSAGSGSEHMKSS
ncbi:hypothetical protein LTR17_019938 [Elasticomyces elasticus]|nr:hypothetical protein LTR17_019938 [Elasticomyces elasticus]